MCSSPGTRPGVSAQNNIMKNNWPERLEGYKLRFSEDDIRTRNGIPVVFLDEAGSLPVPDINLNFHRGYHSKLTRERVKLFSENYALNKRCMNGGLKKKFGSPKKAIILGGGAQRYLLKTSDKDTTTIGVGNSIKSAHSDMDYYICNNPYKEALNYQSRDKKPIGIFSFSVSPEFIRNYKGLKFFYSSGWEPSPGNTHLVDLIDPISVAFSLLCQTECSKIALANFSLSYKDKRPGTIQLGDNYLYQQQLKSLSLVSALIFWTRRGERDVYILDELFDSEIPRELLENFKEENDAW